MTKPTSEDCKHQAVWEGQRYVCSQCRQEVGIEGESIVPPKPSPSYQELERRPEEQAAEIGEMRDADLRARDMQIAAIAEKDSEIERLKRAARITRKADELAFEVGRKEIERLRKRVSELIIESNARTDQIDELKKLLSARDTQRALDVAEIERLRGLVRIGAQWLSEISSRDGSGHADLSRRLLEMLIEQEGEIEDG